MFEFTNKNYYLRNASILKRNRYFAVHYGSESLASLALKIWEFTPDSIREVKPYLFLKIKLKPGQLINVHVDFAKIIQGKLGLFKAAPITFISMISSFSFLGHWRKILEN